MVDDDPWAEPPDGGETTGPEASTRRRRWILPVLIAVLVLVVLAAGWVVAAKQGVRSFDDQAGGAHGDCDDDLEMGDVRPDHQAPSGLPDGLDEVAAAFDAYFAQERLSFTDVSVDETGGRTRSEIRFSVDGDVYERRESDGFVGLIKPGAGIARFEGDRFWVPACVNGFPLASFFQSPDCVEHSTEGDTTTVRWATVRDGACDEALLWHGATLVDGDLTAWSMEAAGRFRTTWEVGEPVDLSWPSPLWIVPAWLT